MALWVDKHRPSSLDKLHYHPEVSDQLKQLVRLYALRFHTLPH